MTGARDKGFGLRPPSDWGPGEWLTATSCPAPTNSRAAVAPMFPAPKIPIFMRAPGGLIGLPGNSHTAPPTWRNYIMEERPNHSTALIICKRFETLPELPFRGLAGPPSLHFLISWLAIVD